MAVGIIDHETGTRDIRRLSGLWRHMPLTATLAMVASAAMAGVPLLNGFISKEMFFSEAVFLTAAPWFEVLLPAVAVVAGVFSVAYALRFSADVFFGPDTTADLPRRPHEPPRWMRVPVDLLVLACLVVGVAPQWSMQDILDTAAAARGRRHAAAIRPGAVARLQPAAGDEPAGAGRRPAAVCVAAWSAGARTHPAGAAARARPRQAPVPAGPGAAHLGRSARCAALRHTSAAAADAAAGDGVRGCGVGIDGVGGGQCRSERIGGQGGRRRLGHRLRRRQPREAAFFAHLRAVVGRGRRRRHRLRLAGQVPPPQRAGADERGRAGHGHHLRAVFGAGPGADTVVGRDGDHRAHPARPALAAQAQRSGGRAAAGAAARTRTRQARRAIWLLAGSAGMRPGAAVLCADDAAVSAEHLAVLPVARVARGRRHERRQRHAGRFPRPGHARRDHRAGRGGADGVCAAAPLSPGAREHGAAAAAAGRAGRPGERPDQLAQRRRHGARLPAGAGRAGAPGAADRDGDRGLPVHARPQRARRRLRRRAGAVHRVHPAVHRVRHAVGRSPPAAAPATLDGLGPAHRHGHRTGLAVLRLSVPDHAHRASAVAAAGRAAPGQRAVLRHRRVHAGGRRRAADPGRAGAPVGARPPPRRAHATPLDVAPSEVPDSSAPVAEPR